MRPSTRARRRMYDGSEAHSSSVVNLASASPQDPNSKAPKASMAGSLCSNLPARAFLLTENPEKPVALPAGSATRGLVNPRVPAARSRSSSLSGRPRRTRGSARPRKSSHSCRFQRCRRAWGAKTEGERNLENREMGLIFRTKDFKQNVSRII